MPLNSSWAIMATVFFTRRAESRTDGFWCQHSRMSREKLERTCQEIDRKCKDVVMSRNLSDVLQDRVRLLVGSMDDSHCHTQPFACLQRMDLLERYRRMGVGILKAQGWRELWFFDTFPRRRAQRSTYLPV